MTEPGDVPVISRNALYRALEAVRDKPCNNRHDGGICGACSTRRYALIQLLEELSAGILSGGVDLLAEEHWRRKP